ncbi:MAG: hypothetical protein MZW92_79560 [Comamonadaceae bacterium]|nr:hypothetical protein [Comamonadaceae bacterium]
MPTRAELIATGRTDEEICREIGADALIYQDLDALKAGGARRSTRRITGFETSCFDGHYITGDVTAEYLHSVEIAARRVEELRPTTVTVRSWTSTWCWPSERVRRGLACRDGLALTP